MKAEILLRDAICDIEVVGEFRARLFVFRSIVRQRLLQLAHGGQDTRHCPYMEGMVRPF